jgi:hypothetical protein
MADGSTVAIRDIRVGDLVLSPLAPSEPVIYPFTNTYFIISDPFASCSLFSIIEGVTCFLFVCFE